MKGIRTPLHCSFLSKRFSTLLLLAFSTSGLIAQILPPLPADLNRTNQLPGAVSLFVREFQFEGNHAFTSTELKEVTRPFTNRQLSSGDLEQARRNVSLYYVSHGYLNSGAMIPDQDPMNGIIVLCIVE